MKQRTVLMALGFAAAFCGDALLVFMRYGVRTTGFLFGVLAFSCAHILWMAANRHGVRFEWRALAVVLPPVMGLLAVRAMRCIPFTPLLAASAYTAVSAVSLAAAGCSLLPSVGPDYKQPEIDLPALCGQVTKFIGICAVFGERGLFIQFPAFSFENFELGNKSELQSQFPQHADLIEQLCRIG